MQILLNKKILLGITGGIAAYKSCELIRLFQKAGADVKVIMTPNATRFITPLTVSSLCGSPAVIDMFATSGSGIDHIEYTRWADLMVIAPASANTLAKITHGIADNFLTTAVLATETPLLVAPAMNVKMYQNQATQENIDVLKKRGVRFSGPEVGYQACGESGPGRMTEPQNIFRTAAELLLDQNKNKKIVITAGPTQEPLDPVRCLTNLSSGKMGYALAQAAAVMGWKTTLISGPVTLEMPVGVEALKVKTAAEMMDAVWQNCKDANCFIGCAAVADFRPEKVAPNKIKKSSDEESLKLILTKNPDIIASLASLDHLYTVGFAAETENLLNYARNKLHNKKLNMIIANDVSKKDIGFNSDFNQAVIITDNGDEIAIPRMSKDDLALRIINEIENKLQGKKNEKH